MRWELSWSDDAEADLAKIYVNAANKPAVTRSATIAERKLMHDPLGFGTQRSEGLWHLDSGTLRLYYEVESQSDHVIKVFAVGELTTPNH